MDLSKIKWVLGVLAFAMLVTPSIATACTPGAGEGDCYRCANCDVDDDCVGDLECETTDKCRTGISECCQDSDNYVNCETTIVNPLKWGSIEEIIKGIADIIYYLAIPITVLMTIISGVMFMFSKGDPQQLDRARKTLIYAAIGLLIIALSKAIASFITTLIGG